MIADEPVSRWTCPSGAQVLLLLQELQANLVLPTFYFAQFAGVAQIATRIAVMRAGKLIELGDAEQASPSPPAIYERPARRGAEIPVR